MVLVVFQTQVQRFVSVWQASVPHVAKGTQSPLNDTNELTAVAMQKVLHFWIFSTHLEPSQFYKPRTPSRSCECWILFHIENSFGTWTQGSLIQLYKWFLVVRVVREANSIRDFIKFERLMSTRDTNISLWDISVWATAGHRLRSVRNVAPPCSPYVRRWPHQFSLLLRGSLRFFLAVFDVERVPPTPLPANHSIIPTMGACADHGGESLC